MSEFFQNANGFIALITGLIGVISAGITVFFTIKAYVSKAKEKSKAENWALIMEIADKAMTSVEKSKETGADKKATVIAAVKASCEAAGLDISEFIDKLDAYIDSAITWYNSMKK